jgi:hypothetical protein
VPQQDALVLTEGGTTPLHAIVLGSYTGGVHHIATDLETYGEFDGNINNHLLNANGVVAADYMLQMFQTSDKMKEVMAQDHDTLPVIGSVEYSARNSHLRTEFFAITAEEDRPSVPAAMPASFRAYGQGPSRIPDHARQFITDVQAAALDSEPTLKKRPFSNKANISTVQYLFKLYNAFFPDVNFYLDWENPAINAYSFEEYGQKFVVVCGGLVRVEGLYLEGMALILAHELGHLYGGEPHNTKGYSCQTQADYHAVGVVTRQVWFGDLWGQIVNTGFEQISDFLGKIPAEQASGKPEDSCNYPSIQCRLDTMDAAISGLPLPFCAGGPKPLEVVGAEVVQKDTGQVIVVTLNEAVRPYAGNNPANYTLAPESKITAARVDPNAGDKVTLEATLQPGTTYVLSVSNLISVAGASLDSEKNSAEFQVDKGEASNDPNKQGPSPR